MPERAREYTFNTGPSMGIVFTIVHPDAVEPARATEHSAGYDLRACVKDREVRVIRDGPSNFEAKSKVRDGRLTLSPRSRALVPLGFKARLPEGIEAQIRIRSSVAFKKGLTIPNAPGTIDADYPDEWMVMMRNDSGADVTIEHGERIAQVIFAKFETMEWTPGEVGISTDRQGGVGSTGSF